MHFLLATPVLVAQQGRRVGLKKLFERLADGDPIAWTFVIGLPGVFILGGLVGSWWARRKGSRTGLDPAQIVAARQKQRRLCFFAGVPLFAGLILNGVFTVSGMMDNGGFRLGTWVGQFVGFAAAFVGMVMLVVNARCPACGSSMRDWHRNLTFCSKCGARLEDTEPPREANSGAAPNQSFNPTGNRPAS